MSIDNSLKVKSGLLRQRNVLTRAERLDKLRKAQRWNDGDAVLGLPKVRTQWKQKSRKKDKKKAEDDTATETPADDAS